LKAVERFGRRAEVKARQTMQDAGKSYEEE
jgi:hypothetical protein